MQWISKVHDWPQVLLDFDGHLNLMYSPDPQETWDDQAGPCVRIARAIARLYAGRQSNKVLHNFLVAAMHIAYIKETNFNGSLPDIPDVFDQYALSNFFLA